MVSINNTVFLISVGLGVTAMAAVFLLRNLTFSSKPWTTIPQIKRRLAFVTPALWSTAGIAGLIFLGGTWLFGNLVPAVFAGVMIVLIPYQIAYRSRRKNRLNALSELSTVVKKFAGHYEQSGQIMAAMEIVGRDPGRIPGLIKTAHSQMIYNVDPDVTLNALADRIDLPYGHIFVDLIKQARKQGAVTIQLFDNLADRIENEQDVISEADQSTVADKVFNSVLAVLFVPTYLLLQNLVPLMSMWLTQTFAGRMVATCCFLSVVAWFFVERVVDEF